ncbi:MAG: hypothetical protein C4327_08115 [Meiothermus sp.]
MLLALLGPALLLVGFAQRSGGGAGGRGGFRSPSVPRVNPSPAPSFPLPTPSRPYSTPPVYPVYPAPPVYVTPGIGGGGIGMASIITILVLGLIAYSVVRGLGSAARGGGGLGAPEAEVARLRLALLYSPELQGALRRLAEQSDTETPQGLADLVDDAAALLLREQSGWKFGSYENWRGSLEQAEGQFDRWMTEDRSTYVETYRKFEGRVETHQADYTPRLEPDKRYLLVSLLLAHRGLLPEVPKPLRAAGARQALLALSASTPLTTLAAYLSWTPEVPGEALSEQDLLTGWPGLELL